MGTRTEPHDECFVDRLLWLLLEHPPRNSDRGALALLFLVYALVVVIVLVR